MSALPVVGADDAGAERGGDEAADRDGAVPGGPDWVPRVVALDLDGTVVENDGTVARPDVVAAVEIALAAGAHVLIATGRAVSSTLDVAESLGIGDAQLVCSNGAVVFDGRAGEASFQATFDPGPPARSLTEHLPGVDFAVEVGLEGFRTTEGFLRDFPGVYLGVVELDELVRDPTVRLIARGPDGHDLALIRRAGELSLGDAYGWWTGHSSGSTSRSAACPRRREWPGRPSPWGSMRPMCWLSATAGTTSSCWPGPGGESRWGMLRPAYARLPTPSPAGWPTAGPPRSSASSSPADPVRSRPRPRPHPRPERPTPS